VLVKQHLFVLLKDKKVEIFYICGKVLKKMKNGKRK